MVDLREACILTLLFPERNFRLLLRDTDLSLTPYLSFPPKRLWNRRGGISLPGLKHSCLSQEVNLRLLDRFSSSSRAWLGQFSSWSDRETCVQVHFYHRFKPPSLIR